MFKISSYNNRFQLFSSLHPHPMHPSVGSPRRGSLHSLNTHRPDSGGRNGARSRWKTLAKTLRYHPFVTSAHVWTFSNPTTYLPTIVLFIPYSCLLVFGILVISVAWFSFHFFRLALQNVNKDYVKFC